MKHSLSDYSLNIPEEQYHAYPAWSYSIIAKYARNGFSAIATLHDKTKPTPEMEFGSLFDSILTKGRKTLDEYIVDSTNMTIEPAEKAVFDTMLSMGYTEPYESLSIADIENAMNKCDSFCSKYKKQDTRRSHLLNASGYYNLRRTGKKVVSQIDWDDAVEMARVFRNDAYLKTIFGTKSTDDVEYIYQSQFVITVDIEGEDVKVKFMPDLMIVNHTQKTIQLVDLKTSSIPGYEFADHFLKLRYDIQGELYSDGIKQIISTDPEYSDYTVLPYLFTDISRTDKVPVTYQIDFSNGFSFTKGDKVYQYKTWKELLAEILVYEANEAKVPSYIRTDGPNDLLEILSR